MAIPSSFSATMDELACRSFSLFSPQSPACFFSGAGGQHPPVLEFECCDVPEQWLELEDDDGAAAALGHGAATSSAPAAGNDDVPDKDKPPAAPAPKWRRRGRKPGPRTVGGPVLSHVETERQRRDKLNHRFCDLRAAVPTVSKMDRASLLADATAYIAELRARAERLEVEVRRQQQQAAAAAPSSAAVAAQGRSQHYLSLGSDKFTVAQQAWDFPHAAADVRPAGSGGESLCVAGFLCYCIRAG